MHLKGGKSLYVYTELCKESIVHDSEQPLMRRMEKYTKYGWSYQFQKVFYLPVRKKELLEFNVYLMYEDGSNPSFLNSPLHMKLHLKQYPFLSDYE